MLNTTDLNALIASIKAHPLAVKMKMDDAGSRCWCADLVLTQSEAKAVDALAIRRVDQGRTVKMGFDDESILVASRGTHNGTRLAYRLQVAEYVYA